MLVAAEAIEIQSTDGLSQPTTLIGGSMCVARLLGWKGPHFAGRVLVDVLQPFSDVFE